MTAGTIVRVVRPQPGLWGGVVRRGETGRVVATAGLLQPRVQIELASGVRVWVPRRDVRPTWAQGDSAWRHRVLWEQAKLVSGLITALCVLVPGLVHRARGGDPVLYALGLVEGLAEVAIAWLLGPYGLLVAVGLLAWWKRRGRTVKRRSAE